MFSQTKTEKEQDEVMRKYKLSLLKKRKLEELKRKKATTENVDNVDVLFEPKKSNVFASYVDFIVVKNFVVENLTDRLNINKDVAVAFITKLNMEEVYVLSSNLQDFIKFIKATSPAGINDYILKTNFVSFKVQVQKQEQEKTDQETIDESIEDAKDAIGSVIDPVQALSVEEIQERKNDLISKAEEALTTKLDEIEQMLMKEKNNKVNIVKGIFIDSIKVLKASKSDFAEFQIRTKKIGIENLKQELVNDFKSYLKNYDIEDIEEKSNNFIDIFFITIMDVKYRGAEEPSPTKGTPTKGTPTKGTPSGTRNIAEMFKTGSGVAKPEYVSLGKYYIKNQRLDAENVLQVRNKNGKQILGVKPMRISSATKAKLDKIIKNEPITYSDVLDLNDDEKDELYSIASKLKIQELMKIPSKLKTKEDKLRDEFNILKGEIINGNDNPQTIKKFKLVLLKCKSSSLINVHQYNELLVMLHELGF